MLPAVIAPLHDGWLLDLTAGAVPIGAAVRDVAATVPGCVHTDLLAAKVIPDPFLDRNEELTAWVGRADWRYRRPVAPLGGGHERIDLVCAGLDTVADLTLAGRPVGSTRNMHRSYRFDVTEALAEGPGLLEIAFRSASAYGEEQRERLGDRPNSYPAPHNFVRKMACSFGWDWGPSTGTAGIWREIALHGWSTARLAVVRPEVTVDATTGHVAVHAEIERTVAGRAAALTVRAAVGDRVATVEVPAGATAATVRLEVPDPALWWPRGYGEQALHLLRVELLAGRDVLDVWERRIGFRTVALDQTPDAAGSRFALLVNGTPVLVKGLNWIPDDAFVTRLAAAAYHHRVRQATGCGANLLRVWGGGLYESADFYAACDVEGVLVWQDFPFACAAYPEEEPLRSEVEAEARENVVRLMPHPSLALWCGNNENIWGFHDWNWQEQLAERTWGEGYYLELLPKIVAELDPTRPYLPASPYAPPGVHPNADGHGPKHIWDVWNERDWTAYREYRPRFVAEFGWQAPPAFATLRRAVSDEPLTPTSPGVLHHQKALDGNGKLARGLAHHFPEPAGFADWHFLTQVNQARAATAGIEHFRALAPHCTGTVWWQLNDCWPVTSWSAIDGDGRRKPVWYALRRVHAERLAVVIPSAGGLRLALLNDTDTAWSTEVVLSRRTLDGSVLAEALVPMTAERRAVATADVPAALARPERPERELLLVEAPGGLRALWFFAEDRDIDYPQALLDTQVEQGADGVRLLITARSFVRDLVIAADRVHPAAEASDALLTLLPGERAEVFVRCPEPVDGTAFTRSPVLRTVNDAVRDARHLTG